MVDGRAEDMSAIFVMPAACSDHMPLWFRWTMVIAFGSVALASAGLVIWMIKDLYNR